MPAADALRAMGGGVDESAACILAKTHLLAFNDEQWWWYSKKNLVAPLAEAYVSKLPGVGWRWEVAPNVGDCGAVLSGESPTCREARVRAEAEVSARRSKVSETSFSVPAAFNPDWVSPPGVTILRILREKDIPVHVFEAAMKAEGVEDPGSLIASSPITLYVAEALSKVLGGTPAFWLAREAGYKDAAVQDALTHLSAHGGVVEDRWLQNISKGSAALDFLRSHPDALIEVPCVVWRWIDGELHVANGTAETPGLRWMKDLVSVPTLRQLASGKRTYQSYSFAEAVALGAREDMGRFTDTPEPAEGGFLELYVQSGGILALRFRSLDERDTYPFFTAKHVAARWYRQRS